MNIRFKHAVLTKLALIAGLLFISLWLWDLQAFGLVNNDGDLLPLGTDYIFRSVQGSVDRGTVLKRSHRADSNAARKTLDGSLTTPRPIPEPACAQGVASPVSLSKQKECFSMAELYVRLLWEDQKWFEPTEKDLGSH